MVARRLQLQFELNYRRPLEVRAVVAELREKATREDWACLEALAMEILRQAAVDQETVWSVAKMGVEAPDVP